MTVRIFSIGALLTALISWGILTLIVMWLDPVSAGWIGFLLFFLVLFIATATSCALVGYGVRRRLCLNQHPSRNIRPSIRQGIWIALFLDILLFLQLIRVMRWWIAVIVILLFSAVELIFTNHDPAPRTNSTTG